jgi:hypothetical protein
MNRASKATVADEATEEAIVADMATQQANPT